MQYMARNIVSCINWYVYASSCSKLSSSLFTRNIIKTPAATTISLETRITAPENNKKRDKMIAKRNITKKKIRGNKPYVSSTQWSKATTTYQIQVSKSNKIIRISLNEEQKRKINSKS